MCSIALTIHPPQRNAHNPSSGFYRTVPKIGEALEWEGADLLGTAAGFAVAADFGAAYGDLDARIALNLPLQLFVEVAFHFANLAATQACDMDMVAHAMALVVVPVAVNMQQIELIE